MESFEAVRTAEVIRLAFVFVSHCGRFRHDLHMTYRIGLKHHKTECYVWYEGFWERCLDFLRYARYKTMPKMPSSRYGRTSISRMPWAKLVATNRPSADCSRAARHIAQPCPKAEDSRRPIKPIDEITVNNLRISADPDQMRCVAQGFRECERKQNYSQNQWRKCQQHEV